ncbi:enoyl-CoA hydratase-related protein [Pseudomonas aeruginosa]|uniref:enoyl-CoA hydratase-related protein n=1 Tax=Pseudomonas aeruginosa TaxID=287 RepID=UPI0020430EE2|nr:enoyl-CoA hydratase-related protein [Pseudomonas aeruginosa]MCM3916208.1 enoyl-CoA hydratase-related protein [Pseudomonas aeruginosa]MCM3928920.1 enoyl-CoA hydratase-related protein [Pseudomonas aeruginosa]WHV79541.1 enoyl-CoA hydratase-related protein [Pseudomonas aeruginosa]
MSHQSILYDTEDRVAVIRFNRPQALNALTPELMDAFGEALTRAANDVGVGAILITGEGRGFSAGADLAHSLKNPVLDDEGNLDLRRLLESHYNPVVQKMARLPKPIIAAVNGMAAGAGASLALMADLTIAARSAYFLQAFVNVGLIPDAGGTWLLPQTIGMQRAMGLALLGEKLPAELAKEWGLIWDVADDDQLLTSSMHLAKRLATGPALAIARIKSAIRSAPENDLDSQLSLEGMFQRECGVSKDFMEGVVAFTQKRKPSFSGS